MFVDASVSLLVWTTTPWTIPANKAVCVHPKARYCVVHRQNSGGSSEHLIVAADRLKDIQLALNQELPVLRTVSGEELKIVMSCFAVLSIPFVHLRAIS
jgi:isoleucyl-tRNA synthetase